MNQIKFSAYVFQEFSLPAINTMTSLLRKTAQSRHVDDLPLITQSAKNLGSCLNSVLKAGATIASGTLGSNLQEQVKISFKVVSCPSSIKGVFVVVVVYK